MNPLTVLFLLLVFAFAITGGCVFSLGLRHLGGAMVAVAVVVLVAASL